MAKGKQAAVDFKCAKVTCTGKCTLAKCKIKKEPRLNLSQIIFNSTEISTFQNYALEVLPTDGMSVRKTITQGIRSKIRQDYPSLNEKKLKEKIANSCRCKGTLTYHYFDSAKNLFLLVVTIVASTNEGNNSTDYLIDKIQTFENGKMVCEKVFAKTERTSQKAKEIAESGAMPFQSHPKDFDEIMDKLNGISSSSTENVSKTEDTKGIRKKSSKSNSSISDAASQNLQTSQKSGRKRKTNFQTEKTGSEKSKKKKTKETQGDEKKVDGLHNEQPEDGLLLSRDEEEKIAQSIFEMDLHNLELPILEAEVARNNELIYSIFSSPTHFITLNGYVYPRIY